MTADDKLKEIQATLPPAKPKRVKEPRKRDFHVKVSEREYAAILAAAERDHADSLPVWIRTTLLEKTR